MKNIKKIDNKKVVAKKVDDQKARSALKEAGKKAVAGCPELSI